MNDDPSLESNVRLLVRAAMPPDARPAPGRRAAVYARLEAMVAAGAASSPFPDRLVAALAAVLVACAVGIGIPLAGRGLAVLAARPVALLAAIVILNLAMVPVASVVVVRRRRHV